MLSILKQIQLFKWIKAKIKHSWKAAFLSTNVLRIKSPSHRITEHSGLEGTSGNLPVHPCRSKQLTYGNQKLGFCSACHFSEMHATISVKYEPFLSASNEQSLFRYFGIQMVFRIHKAGQKNSPGFHPRNQQHRYNIK